jgi:hypothetical protein
MEKKEVEKEEPVRSTVRKDTLLVVSIIVIISIIIIIVSVNRILNFEEEAPTMTYNGFVFTKYSDFWHFNWQSGEKLYKVSLRFNPEEAEEVTIIGNNLTKFNENYLRDGTVYVTFNPLGTNFTYIALGAAELSLNLARALDIEPTGACTVYDEFVCGERPIVRCEDEDKAVIFIRNSDENQLILKNNCIIVQGSGMELLRVIDRLLYQWYRVIN